MALPAESMQTFPPRNPRRRQRKEVDEGGSLRQPLRKRSKMDGQDIPPESAVNVNGAVMIHETREYASRESSDRASPNSLEIPIRGRHRSLKHPAKDDNSTTWTKNHVYDVKQIPGLPKQLQSQSIEYRGAINTTSGHALAVTREQILVWNYTSTTHSPEAHLFTPSQTARGNEPLPFASFVTVASNSDIGLVLVNASSGHITYWENVEDADALSLFEQRRNGIEGSCGTLMYGESVVSLENVEHAGFMITFSSGRVAQLLVRDTQSKSCVTVNFLQGKKTGSGSGFLTGLKNVFGSGALMKNITATRSLPTGTRGEMMVIISNMDATFQFWHLGWAGQASLLSETSAHAVLRLVMDTSLGPDQFNQHSEIKILDFAVAASKQSSPESTPIYDLVALVSISTASAVRYALVELEVKEMLVTVVRALPLHLSSPITLDDRGREPRLCLPKSSSMAFITFPSAVIVVSLRRAEMNEQAFQDSGSTPEPFQDTFHFRDDHDYVILDQTPESISERTRHATMILFVKGCGLIRVNAKDGPRAHKDDSAEYLPSHISASEKIEQAIFFGTISTNPLDLSRRPEHDFQLSEIETAALEISEKVLTTDTPFLPAVAPSMDHHLEQRARILDQLARHLRETYPSISRTGKWRLLWNAEKIAAARKIWSLYDKAIKGRGLQQLLPKMLYLLHENYKTGIEHEIDDYDHARHWFLRSLNFIPVIVPWTYNAIADMNKHNEVKGAIELLDLTSDANDIIIAALETAFQFRTEKAELYGLLNEDLVDGVLRSGYEGLPEFWTSIYQTLAKVQSMFKNTRKITKDYIEHLDEKGYPTEEKLMKVASDTPRLVELCCKIYEERARWYLGQQDEKFKHSGQSLWEAYERVRYDFITQLSEMGLAQSGMTIAEKHHDLQALVFLIMEEADYAVSNSSPRQSPAENDKYSEIIQLMEKRIRDNFKTYGDEWGDALYSAHLIRGQFELLLNQSKYYKEEVTRFLRANRERGKLSWINDVLSEKTFSTAGKVLLDQVAVDESDLWSKKVELSLAKLALAAEEETKPESKDVDNELRSQAESMQLVKIQERLYDHMRPVLYNAMDDAAELQLAMESYGRVTTENRPYMRKVLEFCLGQLLSHRVLAAEQLIDTLTLIDKRPCELRSDDIAGKEFFLAFKALRSSNTKPDSVAFNMKQRLIWRRCFIRDDWKALQEAGHQSDEQAMTDLASTTLFRTLYEGYVESLWDGESAISTMNPESLVGMCISYRDIHEGFPEDLGEQLDHDLRAEDETLRHLIQHFRLEHWMATAKAYAQVYVKEEEVNAAVLAKKTRRIGRQVREEFKSFLGDAEVFLDEDEDDIEDGEEREEEEPVQELPQTFRL